jgi:hypothetical protein
LARVKGDFVGYETVTTGKMFPTPLLQIFAKKGNLDFLEESEDSHALN